MRFVTRWASMAFNSVRLFGRPKHARNIRSARALLRKLSAFESPGAIIAYLRKVNPYQFEELILSLIERDGVFVVRSRSYSGDGGADGSFYWPGKGLCAIQSKRYARAITPAHARAFCELVQRRYRGGVFAHTGRTGDLSKEAFDAPGLGILSGDGLARAIQGARVLPLIEERSAARQRALRSQSGDPKPRAPQKNSRNPKASPKGRS